ncbi:MAG TPA: M4 family metallopeptidase, partial [Tenuifilaceae bacterium]|nr:M4 family metallopeptidase [Tenuifilaceae bacterium]
TITTDSYSGGFRLREISRGGTSTAIQTFNFNRLPAFTFTEVDNGIANATDFSDNNNIWSAAEHANANQDNAALDAHWGAERTFDYFRTVHNRNSYDGNNGLIKSYVHVRTRNSSTGPITDMDNAFWLDSRKAMFYGDGLFFDPTVSLDVCAHEMAHAVCNSTIGNGTGLIYSKESGALNESLSDIWGACVEQWATTGKQTWLCGEDIIPGGGRSMNNPNTHNQPDTYQATNNFWMDVDNCIPSNANDKCGVHTNSGVGNFWFFLLSQGGTGTNDHGNTYDIRGIGITNAARIVYRMEDVYLNPTDGYNNARTASIFAATDLFGANSCEVISTTNAWYAVGVGSSFQYSNVSISGASSVCASGTNFTINNIPTGCTINWTYSSNLQSYGSGSNYISLKAIGGGSGWVRAILNSGCGQVTLPQKNVHVGITASFSGNSSVLYLGTGTWTATASCGSAPYNYDWFLRKDGTGSGAISIATTNKLTLQSVIAGSAYVLSEKADDPIINQPITNTVFYLYARAYDANGNVYITPEQRILAYGDVDLVPANMPYTQKSASITETQESGQTDTYLEIYPNPASDNLTVNILSSTVDQEDKIVISVFDVNMTKSKQIYTDSKQNNINISDLNKGIYFIQVQFCGEQWIEKIIVE